MNPRVIEVSPEDNYILKVKFKNGEVKFFDVSKYFDYEVYKPLQNKEYFQRAFVSHGTVGWPNDIDFDPDTIYLEAV